MTEFESKDHLHLITELNEYDVLCGRGSGPNERVGNINFRDLVNTRKEEYLAINPRDYTNKNRIARKIVEVVRSHGGRFIKKLPSGLCNNEADSEFYELVDETTVLEKAKQALRQNRTVRSESRITANTHTGKQHRKEAAEVVPESDCEPAGLRRVSHVPPQPNQYQTFGPNLNLKTAAESAIRNLQLQNHLAQVQNPSFATARVGIDTDQHRQDIAMHQYKAMQDYYTNNMLSGQRHLHTITPADQIKSHLDLAQQKQPQQNYTLHNSTLQTPSFATAWEGINSEISHSSASAHYRHNIAMQQHKAMQDYHTNNILSGQSNLATIIATDLNQIKSHLDVAEQKQPQESSTLQTPSFATAGGEIHSESSHLSTSTQYRHNIAMEQGKAMQDYHINSVLLGEPNLATAITTRSDKSLIDILEEMSLPSVDNLMSLGEISDFSSQEPPSLSRSKRGVGGTIAEVVEMDFTSKDKPSEAAMAAMLQAMNSQTHGAKESHWANSRPKHPSLSSYYREMKRNSDAMMYDVS